MRLVAWWPLRSRCGQSMWKTIFAIIMVLLIILLIWLAFGHWITETTKSVINAFSPGAAKGIVNP